MKDSPIPERTVLHGILQPIPVDGSPIMCNMSYGLRMTKAALSGLFAIAGI